MLRFAVFYWFLFIINFVIRFDIFKTPFIITQILLFNIITQINKFLLVTFMWILRTWTILLLVASRIFKLTFSITFLDDWSGISPRTCVM